MPIAVSDVYKRQDGHFIWPGFGDNLRVLEWILKRCDNEVDAVETAIGYVPKPEDINLEGLKDFDEEKLASILKVDNAKWAKEAAGVEEFYKKFGDKLPQELRDELNGLEERTKACLLYTSYPVLHGPGRFPAR